MELVLEHFSIEMVKIIKDWKLSLKLFILDFETFYIRYLLRIQCLQVVVLAVYCQNHAY